MNKKGFTLIELLGVITLLAVIGGIAYASITAINQNIKEKMIEKKLEMIEEAAIIYGGDIKGSIINSSKKYNNNPCISIIVSDLVPNNLDADNNNTCLTASSSATQEGCIVDPSDNTKYLDKKEVIIYYKNKRVHAKVDYNDNLSCR